MRSRLLPPPPSLLICHCIETHRKGLPLAGFSDPGFVSGCLRSWTCPFSASVSGKKFPFLVRDTGPGMRSVEWSLRKDGYLPCCDEGSFLLAPRSLRRIATAQEWSGLLRRSAKLWQITPAEKVSILGARVARRRSGALHSREDGVCKLRWIASTVAKAVRVRRQHLQHASLKRHQPNSQRPHIEKDTNTKSDRVGMRSRRSEDHN